MEKVSVPLDYHIYFLKTKSCRDCHQPLRQEVHAYNHYNKYHNPKRKVVTDTPRYFVWFECNWVEVNMETCLAAMHEKRAYAITKPKNVSKGAN